MRIKLDENLPASLVLTLNALPVEILSPSTAAADRSRKMQMFAPEVDAPVESLFPRG